MKKEKKMIIGYILIIILLVFLFIVLKFGINRRDDIKIKPKEKNTTVLKEQKEEKVIENIDKDLDINSAEVKKLVKKIKIFDSYKSGSYYGYFYKNGTLTYDNIADDVKVAIGITQNKNFNNDFINATYDAQAPDGTKLDVIIISKEDVQKGINDFFGPNTSYVDTNLRDSGEYCGFSKFRFDETRNVYMSDPITCQGFPTPYIDSKVISAHRKDNIIEITIKVAYIKFQTNSNGDIIKQVFVNDDDYAPVESHKLLTDNSYNIDRILNKINTFKFQFTLASNNYFYFTKVEKI